MMIEDTYRKIKMSPELMDQLATRDIDGNLLTVDWGEPDDEGFYCPTISVDYDDNILSREREFIAIIEALMKIPALKWCNLVWDLRGEIWKLSIPNCLMGGIEQLLEVADSNAAQFLQEAPHYKKTMAMSRKIKNA